jgi:hypothetical protein
MRLGTGYSEGASPTPDELFGILTQDVSSGWVNKVELLAQEASYRFM